jgi:hypothetical protein
LRRYKENLAAGIFFEDGGCTAWRNFPCGAPALNSARTLIPFSFRNFSSPLCWDEFIQGITLRQDIFGFPVNAVEFIQVNPRRPETREIDTFICSGGGTTPSLLHLPASPGMFLIVIINVNTGDSRLIIPDKTVN